MPELRHRHHVFLLFDGWYSKKEIFCLLDEYKNREIICSVRHDSMMHDLPLAQTGKRGRHARHEKHLSLTDDFMLSDEKIGGYYIGTRMMLTKIFSNRYVYATVTATDKTSQTRRLFRWLGIMDKVVKWC